MNLRQLLSCSSAAAILLICLACAAPQRPGVTETGDASGEGSLSREYDEFRQSTTYRVSYELYNPGAILSSGRVLKFISVSTAPESIGIMLTSSSSEWRFLRCRSVDTLVDGRPLPLPRFEHDGTVGRGYVLETLTTLVPREAVVTMASAEEVRFRFCNDVYSLPGSRLSTLRAFLSQSQAQVLRQRAAPRPVPSDAGTSQDVQDAAPSD